MSPSVILNTLNEIFVGRKQLPMYRHSWFQSNAIVEVDIMAKGIPESQVSVEFSPQSLHIVISDGYDTTFDLYDEINPSESSYTVLKTKVEIRLVKKMAGVQWPRLEQVTSEEEQTHDRKDWDTIEREIRGDEEEDNQGDDVMGFFKKIFADADDDTKKAMMKSYQESGGTALSTNWADVSSKDYKNK
ncbi:hypothetical protein M9435_000917 [Picochlorum sp. BPE23]|nr:hypothetical protein M9435_000917 [Picochlorum sp. BPE23]